MIKLMIFILQFKYFPITRIVIFVIELYLQLNYVINWNK